MTRGRETCGHGADPGRSCSPDCPRGSRRQGRHRDDVALNGRHSSSDVKRAGRRPNHPVTWIKAAAGAGSGPDVRGTVGSSPARSFAVARRVRIHADGPIGEAETVALAVRQNHEPARRGATSP